MEIHELHTEIQVLKAKHIQRERELESLATALKEHMLAEIVERKEANFRMEQLEKKQAYWSGAIVVIIFALSLFDLGAAIRGIS